MEQIIKIASPFQRVLDALVEIKDDFLQYNAKLEILSEQEVQIQYQLSGNEALKQGLIDANIGNNFHTMQGYNQIYKTKEGTLPLTMVSPLFHPKYGLYIHKKNTLGLKTLEDVKKHKNLRVLYAPFNELHIAPCDFARSLFLLKKLELVEVSEQTIKEKGFNLSLKDVKNIYDFEFIKTSHLLEISQKFQDTQKYDLAINCPGMMRDSNFVRVGSIGLGKEENIEPQEDVFLSYAVILATKTGTETSSKVTILKQVLNDIHYKKAQFLQGGITQDYIMVKDQNELREKIKQKWL